MADEADLASEEETAFIVSALNAQIKSRPKLEHTGKCHYCDHPVAEKEHFCDVECKAAWERERKIRQRQGLLASV